MSVGTGPPQPPFIIMPLSKLDVLDDKTGSPHPPRIKRRLEWRLLLSRLLDCLRLYFFDPVNREKNFFKVLIIYNKNKIYFKYKWNLKKVL